MDVYTKRFVLVLFSAVLGPCVNKLYSQRNRLKSAEPKFYKLQDKNLTADVKSVLLTFGPLGSDFTVLLVIRTFRMFVSVYHSLNVLSVWLRVQQVNTLSRSRPKQQELNWSVILEPANNARGPQAPNWAPSHQSNQ